VTPRQQAVLDSVSGRWLNSVSAWSRSGNAPTWSWAVPAHLAESWRDALRELLDELSGEPKNRWEEKAIASIACHNAVRSGQTLSL
jgi:hypothetical protein